MTAVSIGSSSVSRTANQYACADRPKKNASALLVLIRKECTSLSKGVKASAKGANSRMSTVKRSLTTTFYDGPFHTISIRSLFPRQNITILKAAPLQTQFLSSETRLCQHLTPDLDLDSYQGRHQDNEIKDGERPEGCHVRGLGVK
jgi:hypothetical protein